MFSVRWGIHNWIMQIHSPAYKPAMLLLFSRGRHPVLLLSASVPWIASRHRVCRQWSGFLVILFLVLGCCRHFSGQCCRGRVICSTSVSTFQKQIVNRGISIDMHRDAGSPWAIMATCFVVSSSGLRHIRPWRWLLLLLLLLLLRLLLPGFPLGSLSGRGKDLCNQAWGFKT